MTKIALLDVDGVCLDFTRHLLTTIGSSLTYDDVTQYDIFGLIEPCLRDWAQRTLADPDWWARMPRMRGAKAGIKAYRKQGYRVVFVTAPWVSCVGWGWARRKALSRHFKAKHCDVVITSSKELVRGNFFVDDKPETVEAWGAVSANHDALLFDAPYNAGSDWRHRVHWGEKGLERV